MTPFIQTLISETIKLGKISRGKSMLIDINELF